MRAAAFSALRAGLTPYCVDLFSDADLSAHCRSIRLAPGDYPRGFLEATRQAPACPWMYSGGLENQRAIVRDLMLERPLWGNSPHVLLRVRSPVHLARVLKRAGIPGPAIRRHAPESGGLQRWLVKPRGGAGGRGIHFFSVTSPERTGKKRSYFQQYIEGEPHSAIYVGDRRSACLLGVTRQLTGEQWLNAKSFHYCGSVGPLPVPPGQREALELLGNTLVQGTGLCGLFGVDFIQHEGTPWLVEVNPRYTSSVEVLEHGLGRSAMDLHRGVFQPESSAPLKREATDAPQMIGKAILFARAALPFPVDGPWVASVRNPTPVDQLPLFADIPRPGEQIPAGRPILTFFSRGDSQFACMATLRQIAVDLDRWLFGQ